MLGSINFEVVLFALVVVTGLTVFLCKYVFKGVPKEGGSEAIPIADFEHEPWYLDYARSFFPVLLLVFMLRGFLVEPFQIPSGSMLPTLEVGDFILVSKSSYGIRLPILHEKIVSLSEPKRGDIMVFRYPGDNKTNYIKRVIGLPGDKIEYRHKQLLINGDRFELQDDGEYTPFSGKGENKPQGRFFQEIPTNEGNDEKLEFSVLLEPNSSSGDKKITVPEGHYFVLGDNRDHSLDGRFWGFVPDKNIVGKAFFIWFHLHRDPCCNFNFSRIGEKI